MLVSFGDGYVDTLEKWQREGKESRRCLLSGLLVWAAKDLLIIDILGVHCAFYIFGFSFGNYC